MVTNEITRYNFNSFYQVDLFYDGTATIIETTPFFMRAIVKSFIIALILTLLIEFIVAFIFCLLTKTDKKILKSVLVASLITLPVVWFVFPWSEKYFPVWLFAAETFAIVVEAYFINYMNKEIISLKRSFILSLIMNLCSLVLGGFTIAIIGTFFGF